MQPPPPVLAGCVVIAYAVNSDAHASRLAIAEPMDASADGSMDDAEFMLFECDERWSVIEKTAHASVEKAKASRPGVEWVDRPLSQNDVSAYLDELWKDQKCSFCGRRPDQVTRIVENGDVRVCDICVREFRERIATDVTEH